MNIYFNLVCLLLNRVLFLADVTFILIEPWFMFLK